MGLFGEKCSVCHKNRTKRKDNQGLPICPDCELEREAEREVKRECPVDGITMVKEIIEDFIVDRCPKCKGVWLDKGELEHLEELLREDADGNHALGLATGIAIGSAL